MSMLLLMSCQKFQKNSAKENKMLLGCCDLSSCCDWVRNKCRSQPKETEESKLLRLHPHDSSLKTKESYNSCQLIATSGTLGNENINTKDMVILKIRDKDDMVKKYFNQAVYHSFFIDKQKMKKIIDFKNNTEKCLESHPFYTLFQRSIIQHLEKEQPIHIRNKDIFNLITSYVGSLANGVDLFGRTLLDYYTDNTQPIYKKLVSVGAAHSKSILEKRIKERYSDNTVIDESFFYQLLSTCDFGTAMLALMDPNIKGFDLLKEYDMYRTNNTEKLKIDRITKLHNPLAIIEMLKKKYHQVWKPGLYLLGYCRNSECKNHTDEVELYKALGEFNMGWEFNKNNCSLCKKRLRIKKCKFYQCHYIIDGEKENEEEVFVERNAYGFVVREVGNVFWQFLKIEVSPLS